MNKKLIIMGVVVLFVCIGLSGCFEGGKLEDTDGDGYKDSVDAFPNDATEWKDTDSDGYGDNSDDFPTDSDLHKKIIWEEFENEPIEYSTDLPEIHSRLQVTTNTKYVEWDWRLVDPSPYNADIKFYIERVTESKLIKIYEITAWADSGRIVPDYSNIGSWSCTWLNYPYPDEGWGTLYITGTIYAVE